MAAVQKTKTTTPATPEEVWAILREVGRKQDETALELKETGRLVKILTNQMGGLHNSIGELTEHMVGPGIVEKFNSIGYHFNGITHRGCTIADEKGKQRAEIDLLLENGDFIIAVEVKSDVKEKDIEHHINRIKILREYRNKNNDKRKIRGAIAGANFYSKVKELAIAKGFYVFQQSGDTMKMDIPKNFKPKEW